MYIQQLYTNCLSEAAYYIESKGEAAIIDPLRDTDVYLQLAQERKSKIMYIFETHFHADFVSGHLDLSQKTGAPIIFGPGAQTEFQKHNATDGEEFTLGDLIIRAIHTPGHTLESTCYLLLEKGHPHALFTGDTLFVGDVGRPDLFSGDLPMETLAGYLFHSLEKLKLYPDNTLIYPAHGPGSSCGKNLGPQKSSTLGEQKASNYALQFTNESDFIETVTQGLQAPPMYFPLNAKLNQQGPKPLDELKATGLRPLSVQEVKDHIVENTWLIDTRPATLFTQGFIPGSVNIGLEGRFAEWAGSLIPLHAHIILITEPGKEDESLTRLARVGFDQIIGYFEGGYDRWKTENEPIDLIIDIEPDELKMDLNYDNKLLLIDVRKELEFEGGHVQTAVNIPLASFKDIEMMSRFEETDNIYLHCGGGYRSVIAASLLKRQGIHNLRNILGGYDQIKHIPGIPLVAAREILN